MTGQLIAGAETRVNTYVVGDQREQSVAALNDGGYVVTWTSTDQDGSERGVYFQRYDAHGVKIGGETPATTTVVNSQYAPTAIGLADGGFAIAWTSNDQELPAISNRYGGVYVQRFDASGVKLGGETLVNTTTAGDQSRPAMEALPDGGFLVVWDHSLDPALQVDILGQRFSAGGSKIGFESPINTTVTGFQGLFGDRSITLLQDGGHVVVWSATDQDGSSFGVYLQRFDATGARVSGETQVNTSTDGPQWYESVTALKDGGWVVTWQSDNYANGAAQDVLAQRYDATGAPVGGQTTVTTTIVDDQVYPSITTLFDGGYVIAWTSYAQDGSSGGIYYQQFDANGGKVGVETLVNTTTAGEQVEPSIVALTGGGFVVTWASAGHDGSGFGVYQRTYVPSNQAPTAVGDNIVVAEDATSPNLWATLLANDTDPDSMDTKSIISVDTVGTQGSLVFSPSEQTLKYVADADDFDLLGIGGAPGYATDTFTYTMRDAAGATSTATVTVRVEASSDGRSVIGTSNAELIDAGYKSGLGTTLGEDTVAAGSGADTVLGLGGADQLFGGSESDLLDGGAGHDRLDGEGGSDRLVGGDGRDTLIGGSGQDTLTGGTGDDQVIAGSGDDSLEGGDGADSLNGGSGADKLFGGAGSDTLSGDSGDDLFVFAAGGSAQDRDIVLQFGAGDHIQLLNGLTAQSATTAYLSGGSAADTLLTFSDGSSAVLVDFALSSWHGGQGWIVL